MAGLVVVGCNYPNGLILRLFDKQEVWQDVVNGGKRRVEISIARPNAQVRLRGPAHRQGILPKYKIIGRREREGYGLTRVDADFMNEWFEQNKNTDLVKNEVVIMHPKDTVGLAREKQDIRSGLEPLNTGIIRDSDGKEKHIDGRISNRIRTRPKDEDEGFVE